MQVRVSIVGYNLFKIFPTKLSCTKKIVYFSPPEEPELAAGGASTRAGTEASTPGPGQSGSGGAGTVSLSLARRDTSGKIHKSEGKPTRIRTVLTEKQLHTLR